MRNVTPAAAARYIFGYTAAQDISDRTIQTAESQWARCKSFDTFTPLGPYVETKIDPHDLTIQLFQNGQLRQNSNTSQLIFNCFHLVSFISTNMTLLPGDMILTGTPSGVGPIESGDRLGGAHPRTDAAGEYGEIAHGTASRRNAMSVPFSENLFALAPARRLRLPNMRWTQTLVPTLKETPAEAEIISHKLLLRAGLIRKLTGGLYTFLPLGLRALRKVEQIVREEMNRAGALEVLMPALQPPEIWQQSGRYETAQDVLFKVRDRAKKEWVLGPTHEEVITTLVAGEINSYRQMPKNFYQIQTKFRDEIRPRFGLMRAKEFIMKDAYSFDATDEAAQVSYRKMYDAYMRIFQRCGLKACRSKPTRA